MKKLVLIAALAASFATQAFAQSYSHDFGTGNIVNMPAAEAVNGQADGSYASSGFNGASSYAYAPRHVRPMRKTPTH